MGSLHDQITKYMQSRRHRELVGGKSQLAEVSLAGSAAIIEVEKAIQQRARQAPKPAGSVSDRDYAEEAYLLGLQLACMDRHPRQADLFRRNQGRAFLAVMAWRQELLARMQILHQASNALMTETRPDREVRCAELVGSIKPAPRVNMGIVQAARDTWDFFVESWETIDMLQERTDLTAEGVVMLNEIKERVPAHIDLIITMYNQVEEARNHLRDLSNIAITRNGRVQDSLR